ncbi:MAG: hypothetical protein HDT15_11200 [Oscillibacter sp.]|nr:hypothetical protein [Oscillibacter sp.]
MRVSTDDFLGLVKDRICPQSCSIIEQLCDQLQDVIWRNTIVDAMKNYTDHKLEHSYRVLKRALDITDNASNCYPQFQNLSKNEVYVLSFAALLHDICMSGHPKMEMDQNIMEYFDEKKRSYINFQDYPNDPSYYTDVQQNEIRKYHTYFAIAKIKLALAEETHNLHKAICKIPEELLDYIYILIKFHSKESLSEIPEAVAGSKIEDVRLPFIAVLFRLADELDLGEDRDIEAARRQGMPDKSKAYWELDYRLQVSISTFNYIDIKFCANKSDIENYKELFDKLVKDHIEKNEELVYRLHENNLIIRYNKFGSFTKTDNSKESISPSVIRELKKICNFGNSALESVNSRIAFLESNAMNGFRLKKNYMGLVMPYVGDIYKLYVYKEFELLKDKDSIKCKIHINNINKIFASALDKDTLKLNAYISYKSHQNTFKDFIKCDIIDEISAGEEYLQFRLHFYAYKHGEKVKLPIKKGDIIAIFYTYQVYCAHYGNELVRKSGIFTDAELCCEIIYPKKNEKLYDIDFYERDDNGQLIALDYLEECIKRDDSSVLYKTQSGIKFKKLLDAYFNEKNYVFLQADYKKWISLHKSGNEQIYCFAAKWNFVPFFTDPDIYLCMERYINDGSPSGFTKKNITSQRYVPFSTTVDFNVNGFLIDDKNIKCSDYGTSPNWLGDREIIIHPDYERCFKDYKQSSVYTVVPTSSSRTVYAKDKKYYLKLQYNKRLGRLERLFSPEKICNAVKITSVLMNLFDNESMPADIFFMPEVFGRILDFGENFDKNLETRYWGMVIRDTIPYPHLPDTNSSEIRLIPAFSLFAKNYQKMSSRSILQLLYDFRPQKGTDERAFLLEKIIKPAIKLYFEILLRTGLHMEAHSQNILYLLSIEENTANVLGAVIRDFESFDKDTTLMRQLGLISSFDTIKEKVNSSSNSEQYMKRNSFLYDFKFGEYFLTPILTHCGKIFPKLDVDAIISEIKSFSSRYISQLPENFFPKDKWFAYENIDFKRDTSERPWIMHDEAPKYR